MRARRARGGGARGGDALTELREQLGGTVRFCFQPAEEILAGAERMIVEGAMESVDMVLVAHVLSMAPYGAVVAVPGPFLSGADFFELRVIGKSGHAGMPHLSVDVDLRLALDG